MFLIVASEGTELPDSDEMQRVSCWYRGHKVFDALLYAKDVRLNETQPENLLRSHPAAQNL